MESVLWLEGKRRVEWELVLATFKYFNCLWSPGQLALLLCCLLVLHLLVREVSASPSKFSYERAMCSLRKSKGVCVGLLALTCHPQNSSQSGDSMRIYSEEVGHNREERIPFTLVMPYRKQRETNASKVNVIKKKGEKKKGKKKKSSSSFSQRYRII